MTEHTATCPERPSLMLKSSHSDARGPSALEGLRRRGSLALRAIDEGRWRAGLVGRPRGGVGHEAELSE